MPDPPRTPDIVEIFNTHAPFVWRVLKRLGVGETDLDDVCQEVFVVVHQRLAQFEGRSTLRTWLYGICLRRASNYRSRAYRTREVLGAQAPEPVIEPTQIRDLERQQALRWLDRVLATIPAPQREVYVLYELEQMAMQDVADAVGCPLQTAYSRLHAARAHVQREIAPASARKRAL